MEKSTRIQKISSNDLLEYLDSAIRENHYHPYGDPYNTSGFSYHELQSEVIRRLAFYDNLNL